jgi:hypothetical protein
MTNINDELDKFYQDDNDNRNLLKLLIDEFEGININSIDIETFTINPVLSNNDNVKTIDIKKELKNNNNNTLF